MHVESTQTANELYWYAVLSRSRHEKMVATALTNTGITTFLPLVSEMHSLERSPKLVDVPLFPGYVFVQIPNSVGARLHVLKTSGVVQFVGSRRRYFPSRTRKLLTSGPCYIKSVALPTRSSNWGSGCESVGDHWMVWKAFS